GGSCRPRKRTRRPGRGSPFPPLPTARYPRDARGRRRSVRRARRRPAGSHASACLRPPEARSFGSLEGRVQPVRARLALGPLVQAVHLTLAAELDQLDLELVARLEADSGAGRNVEAHSEGLCAVELELLVHLEEVVVRAHLYRTVAEVSHRDRDA